MAKAPYLALSAVKSLSATRPVVPVGPLISVLAV